MPDVSLSGEIVTMCCNGSSTYPSNVSTSKIAYFPIGKPFSPPIKMVPVSSVAYKPFSEIPVSTTSPLWYAIILFPFSSTGCPMA